MNVGELITRLQRYDPQTLVLVSGYEGGLDSHIGVSIKQVCKYKQDWCGDYAEYEEGWTPPPDTAAVCIERK